MGSWKPVSQEGGHGGTNLRGEPEQRIEKVFDLGGHGSNVEGSTPVSCVAGPGVNISPGEGTRWIHGRRRGDLPPVPWWCRTLGFVTRTGKKVLEGALALPEDDRIRIAELLFDSISTGTTEEIEAAWVAKAVQRTDELERGKAEALDGSSILEDLRAKSRVGRT